MKQSTLAESSDWTPETRPNCKRDLAHLRYRRPSDGETAAYRCDSWDCVICGHRMKMNLLEGVDQLLDRRPEMSRLLTLTVDGKRWERREAHRRIGEAWNRLRSYIQATYGDFSYVWVREETDRGLPHLHVLVSRFLPQADISAAWERTGMGSVVDIRRVDARNAGHYLAKYLAKDAMAFLPSGVHRYGSSDDLQLGVRGDPDQDPPARRWVLEAYDQVVEGWMGATSGDFIRQDRPPPPDHHD